LNIKAFIPENYFLQYDFLLYFCFFAFVSACCVKLSSFPHVRNNHIYDYLSMLCSMSFEVIYRLEQLFYNFA